MNSNPVCQRATNFEKWFSSDNSYQIQYEEGIYTINTTNILY